MQENTEALKIVIPDDIESSELFGNLDSNIREIERITGSTIVMRDDSLLVMGGAKEGTFRIINGL
ncbi:MAG: phosphate starvation-inducible protein PhoH, partial [Mogibacterium sp.]|nr:phosphate starvation-inducible protein PhoH [Mogibacterium sp.]